MSNKMTGTESETEIDRDRENHMTQLLELHKL